MKRIRKWLGPDSPQQSVTGEADQHVKARPEQKTEDEYSDDSSIGWEALDRIEDTGPGKDTQDQCDFEDTAPYVTLELEDGPLSDAEEDIGVDPYNTCRFDTENN